MPLRRQKSSSSGSFFSVTTATGSLRSRDFWRYLSCSRSSIFCSCLLTLATDYSRLGLPTEESCSVSRWIAGGMELLRIVSIDYSSQLQWWQTLVASRFSVYFEADIGAAAEQLSRRSSFDPAGLKVCIAARASRVSYSPTLRVLAPDRGCESLSPYGHEESTPAELKGQAAELPMIDPSYRARAESGKSTCGSGKGKCVFSVNCAGSPTCEAAAVWPPLSTSGGVFGSYSHATTLNVVSLFVNPRSPMLPLLAPRSAESTRSFRKSISAPTTPLAEDLRR